jgi:hypothetical protein
MRAWRLAVTLVILVMALICVGTLINSVYGLTHPGPRQEQFVTDLSTQLQEGTVPEIQRIGAETLNSVNFQDEFNKLNARTPELAEATMKELQTLSENLPQRGEKVLNETFGEMIQSREEKIRAQYPDVTEEKVHTLGTNLTEEATERTAHLTQALFNPHLKAMNGIVANIHKIASTEAINPHEVPTWQMALLIFDVAREDFKDLEAYRGLNLKGGKGQGVKVIGAKGAGDRPAGAKSQGGKPKTTAINATKKGY